MSKLKQTFKAKTLKPPRARELIKAVKNGDLTAVKSLLARGADINEKNRYDRTPLIEAAARGDYEVCNYLIKKGAALDEQDCEGHTALIAAVFYDGEVAVINALIKAGADLDKEDHEGDTALMLAEKHCSSHVENLLKKAPDTQARIKEQQTGREEKRAAADVAKIREEMAKGIPEPLPYSGPLKFPKPPFFS